MVNKSHKLLSKASFNKFFSSIIFKISNSINNNNNTIN